uniref:IKAROS family zinc finger 4 n=1 Tax=Neogobius melanostomus TaxID=47308 RepID=A0A8C6T9H7_9GOBI
MNADDCNGRSYAGMNKDLYSGQQGPSKSPNSQKSSPEHSLSSNYLIILLLYYNIIIFEINYYPLPGPDKVSVYSEMISTNAASPGPIRLPNGKLQCEVCGMICIGPNVLMVHKRSHTGERPFQCNQCGASFTQKGNLLRHIKLHSGEKPFKCPICNYACRRRDALAGHLRTHAVSSPTVGKPFKCSYCSRSYKQQSTLEDHLERCHSYLKSLDNQAAGDTNTTEDELVNVETITKNVLQPSNDKIQFAEKMSISMTKRKRSTPQKFLGEKHMHLDLPETPYELSSGSEKEGDLLNAHSAGDSVRMSVLIPQGPRAHAGSGLAFCLTGRDPGESQDDQPSTHSLTTSPNGCPDSTDTESTAEDTSNNHHHLHYHTTPLPRNVEAEWGKACPVPPALVKRSMRSPLSSRETMQVLDRDGRSVRSFHCRHCRILFLDHVMFTIHMGCHGFRQPFECNICGHRSQDRYEFSSHISRGEHQLG